MSTPNIVGLDVGLKKVGGKDTTQRAVLVFVIEKKPMAALTDPDIRVPPELEVTTKKPDGTEETIRVPTDVVETGRIRLLTNNQKKRPCPGGYQISVILGSSFSKGTLGVTTAWSGRERVVMTNAHVIAPQQQLLLEVYQPDPNDEGNEFGHVNVIEPVTTYADPNQKDPQYNPYDFAACFIADANVANYQIKDIYTGNDPLPLRAPQENEQVRWLGQQTTDIQQATIESLSTALAGMPFAPNEYAWFKPVLRLSGKDLKAAPGDSGAALVAADNNVVGLVMADAENGYVSGTYVPLS